MLELLRGPLAEMPFRLPVPVLPARAGSVAFDAELRPPGSKSLTNRALLLAGLAEGESIIRGAPLDADDVKRMMSSLAGLGAGVSVRREGDGRDAIVVAGVGGRWRVGSGATLDVGGAGTAARFLAGASLLGDGPVTIDGNERMRSRPMRDLGDVLVRLGARVEYLGREGCLPMRISPGGAGGGSLPGVVDLGMASSSQFVSSLLMIGPWLAGGMTLRLTGAVPSASYISMTLGLLSRVGATVQHSENLRVMRVGPPRETRAPSVSRSSPVFDATQRAARRGLAGFEVEVEPDASGATYFWAAAAMTPDATCRVVGLGGDSLQGDARFPYLLERMGAQLRVEPGEDGRGVLEVRGGYALRPILADMGEMPDAVMTLAVVASLASGRSILRGVRTLRVKESDRIEALTRELSKIGVRVECPVANDDDVMSITPPEGGVDLGAGAPEVEFETYQDHRIAMSLALLGLRRPNVLIRDPACVGKTYPRFWFDLASLYP